MIVNVQPHTKHMKVMIEAKEVSNFEGAINYISPTWDSLRGSHSLICI